MAGASMNDIKSRIKSVTGTMQITKAMELVAASKLRRAQERIQQSRPYYEVLKEAIDAVRQLDAEGASRFFTETEGKTLYIVLAGDRGLAGGFNSNLFRLCESMLDGETCEILPVGKKALEHYKHRARPIFSEDFPEIAEVGVGAAMRLSHLVCEAYLAEKFTRVVLVYTRFISMLTQTAVCEQLLPIAPSDEVKGAAPELAGDAEEFLERVIPEYVGGVIYSAVMESLASESGARRSAMNSANKNASEMIDSLNLSYNRARQAMITQEITEIVSGAEAL